MNDKDTLEFEDRFYVSPTVSRDEQLDFIDNYRNVLQNNVQRINTQTHNLGTDVPSNIGGLTGGDVTFETRYVTPQANSAVAELRAKAQDTALTQALKNLETQMNKRYKDAYRNARISEYNKNNSGDGNDGSKLNIEGEGSDGTDDENKVEDNPNTGEGQLVMTGEGVGSYTRDGQTYTLRDIITPREQIAFNQAVRPFKEYNDGDTASYSGVTFRYIKNSQYPGNWFIQE